jgi:hypothetical protein
VLSQWKRASLTVSKWMASLVDLNLNLKSYSSSAEHCHVVLTIIRLDRIYDLIHMHMNK